MNSTNSERSPEGWSIKKLGDICAIIAGQSPPGNTYRKDPIGLPFFQGKADFGPLHPIARNWCTHPIKVAEPGDILVSVRAPVGPTNVANVKCCIGRGLAAVRCSESVDGDYILAAFKLFEDVLAKQGSGSTFSAIKISDLASFKIPLPPLSEQKRIASILKDKLASIESARATTEVQLEAAKALPSSCLAEIFGGPETERWSKQKLGDHVSKVGSGVTPRGGHSSYLSSGIPLIRSQNIHMNIFVNDGLAFISAEQDEAMQNSRVQKFDVLINITGASIGRVCVVPEVMCPANVNQHVSIIRCNESLNQQYLTYYLSSPSFQKFIWDIQSGATRQALTKNLIENFIIPIPDVATQLKVVNNINKNSELNRTLETKLESLKSELSLLSPAILKQAFNGEL